MKSSSGLLRRCHLSNSNRELARLSTTVASLGRRAALSSRHLWWNWMITSLVKIEKCFIGKAWHLSNWNYVTTTTMRVSSRRLLEIVAFPTRYRQSLTIMRMKGAGREFSSLSQLFRPPQQLKSSPLLNRNRKENRRKRIHMFIPMALNKRHFKGISLWLQKQQNYKLINTPKFASNVMKSMKAHHSEDSLRPGTSKETQTRLRIARSSIRIRRLVRKV